MESPDNIHALETAQPRSRKNAERAQLDAAADLDATLRAIPDLLFELDDKGRYLQVWTNQPELLAAQRELLLGHTVAEMLPAPAAATVLAALQEAASTGHSQGQQISLPLPQGECWFELSTSRKINPTDGQLRFIMLSRDISARKRMEQILQALGTAPTGQEFFNFLTGQLAKLLEVEVAFIGELLPNGRARTRAMIIDGQAVPSLEYDLTGTPCESVMGKTLCVYPDTVQQRFPHDTMLADLGVVAYAAAPLWNSQQRPLGLIGIMGRRRIEQPAALENILRLVALRAGAELEQEHQQRAMRENEEKYQRLVESLGHEYLFYRHDAAGVFTYLSPSIETILGYTPAAFKTHYRQFLTDDPGNALAIRYSEESLRGKPPPPYEVEVRRKDGRPCTLAVSEIPVFDPTGQVVGGEGIAHDITAHKAAERRLRSMASELEQRVEERTLALANKEEETRSLVDNLLDCVINIDGQGIVRSANPAVERILGWRPDELIGQNVSVLTPEPHRSAHDGYLERYQRTNQAHIIGSGREVEGLHKNGQLIPMELAVSEYWVQGKRFFTGTLRDITERKAVEAALQAAKEEAEAANRAKSLFLAAMSHEIRTPMNGVIGMVELLAQGRLDEHQQEMVETVRESSFSLLRVIDDILDFSKLGAGKLTMDEEPLSLERLLEGVCDGLEAVARNKRVDLYPFIDPALPQQVVGDEGRLRQILNNLVGNAIKFSAASAGRGRVAVRATSLGSSDGRVALCLSVADNGIGLSVEEQASLFKPFIQADASTTRRFGGTGLGLSIVKHIVDLLHGDIQISSASGAGATFTVNLNLPIAPGAATAPAAPALNDLECLLVTEDAERAHDLGVYLTDAGAQVRRAATLDAALLQLKTLPAQGSWVVIHDTGLEQPQQEALIALREAVLEPHFLLLLNHGLRHRPRLEAPGIVSLDIELLHRRTLLEAVAIAAGGASAQALASRPEPAPAPAPTTIAAWHLPILVAEDNPINQKVIVRQLQLLGYRAEVAGDGEEALEIWRQGKFSLILSDLHMPKLDGCALAAAIRQEEPAGQRIPILAATANILKEDRERCLKLGMDDVLIKPVQLPVLKAALEKWLAGTLANRAGKDSTAAPPPPSPGLAVLDTAVLEKLLGDNAPTLITEFLDDFQTSARQTAAELHAAWDKGDLAAVGSAAHKLKSSSRAVGALALGELCAALEKSGTAGDRVALSALMPEFEAGMVAVEREIDAR
ncbi:MAG: PAS domain S-box protein [Gammaproteobacteria bacterium]|nr:PAS domain S-box protein [Rhodocyclaceae bacterium]MBU3909905.1 PAS domain S-box protein [Gammaproteobacteria bacterium]MBU3988943.1 PAS domain S-box protein [Gammaproteobacteria bacterium]MBU4003516.1 PAS domain S-box protein [Gammaproteobacteria bacterium]MBU4020125.1 PAS domain S-box protein [Gammaproteobacteria bacterium]